MYLITYLLIVAIIHTTLAAKDNSNTSLSTKEPNADDITEMETGTTHGNTESPTASIDTIDARESDTPNDELNITQPDAQSDDNKTTWTVQQNTTGALTLNVSTRRPSPYWKYCDMTDITHYQLDYSWMRDIMLYVRVYLKIPLAVIGVFGNSLSFFVLRKEKLNSSTFLLQVLAIVDLCVCLGCISHELIMALYDSTYALVPSRTHSVYHDWRRIAPFLDLYLGRYLEILSGWVIALISIDRYIAVCKPLLAPTLSTVGRVRIASIIIFAANALLILGRCFAFTYVELWLPCTDETLIFLSTTALWSNVQYRLWYVTITYGCLTLILPVAIIIVIQILLIIHLREASRKRANLTGQAKGEDRVTLNLTLTLVVVAIVFFICVIPEFAIFIVDVLWVNKVAVYRGKYDRRAYIGSANLFRFCNSVVNFFLYCLLRHGFRKQLLDLFCIKCRTKQKLPIQRKSTVTKQTDDTTM